MQLSPPIPFSNRYLVSCFGSSSALARPGQNFNAFLIPGKSHWLWLIFPTAFPSFCHSHSPSLLLCFLFYFFLPDSHTNSFIFRSLNSKTGMVVSPLQILFNRWGPCSLAGFWEPLGIRRSWKWSPQHRNNFTPYQAKSWNPHPLKAFPQLLQSIRCTWWGAVKAKLSQGETLSILRNFGFRHGCSVPLKIQPCRTS